MGTGYPEIIAGLEQFLQTPPLIQVPVVLVGFDLLEFQGEDVRSRPLAWRRAELEKLAPPASALVLSPVVEATSWEEFARLRQHARAR